MYRTHIFVVLDNGQIEPLAQRQSISLVRAPALR